MLKSAPWPKSATTTDGLWNCRSSTVLMPSAFICEPLITVAASGAVCRLMVRRSAVIVTGGTVLATGAVATGAEASAAAAVESASAAWARLATASGAVSASADTVRRSAPFFMVFPLMREGAQIRAASIINAHACMSADGGQRGPAAF